MDRTGNVKEDAVYEQVVEEFSNSIYRNGKGVIPQYELPKEIGLIITVIFMG